MRHSSLPSSPCDSCASHHCEDLQPRLPSPIPAGSPPLPSLQGAPPNRAPSIDQQCCVLIGLLYPAVFVVYARSPTHTPMASVCITSVYVHRRTQLCWPPAYARARCCAAGYSTGCRCTWTCLSATCRASAKAATWHPCWNTAWCAHLRACARVCACMAPVLKHCVVCTRVRLGTCVCLCVHAWRPC